MNEDELFPRVIEYVDVTEALSLIPRAADRELGDRIETSSRRPDYIDEQDESNCARCWEGWGWYRRRGTTMYIPLNVRPYQSRTENRTIAKSDQSSRRSGDVHSVQTASLPLPVPPRTLA